MLERFSQEEKARIGKLQELANRFGDFLVCTHKTDATWTRHVSVLSCWENIENDAWRLATANNRTLFRNEFVLDFDKGKEETDEEILARVQLAKATLELFDIRGRIFFTGSKGYHVHIQFYEQKDIQPGFFRWFVKRFGTDAMIASRNHMIALEGVPHWKTGRNKAEVIL